MVILGDLMEELIEKSDDKEEYKYHLHMLLHGPHFDDCMLKKSGELGEIVNTSHNKV